MEVDTDEFRTTRDLLQSLERQNLLLNGLRHKDLAMEVTIMSTGTSRRLADDETPFSIFTMDKEYHVVMDTFTIQTIIAPDFIRSTLIQKNSTSIDALAAVLYELRVAPESITEFALAVTSYDGGF